LKERVMHKPLVTCLLILMLLPVSARAAQILEGRTDSGAV